MKWILILLVSTYGPTTAVTSAVFDTKEACEAAAVAFKSALPPARQWGGTSTFYVCTPSR